MPNLKKDKTGKFIKHTKYVDRICENCGVSFQIKESSLKYGRGKCCSRKCVDENKKKTYKGDANPMYGKSLTDERKEQLSIQTKQLWNSSEYRKRVLQSQKEFQLRAKTDGTWERAKLKRENTFLEKYGVVHNWNGVYGTRLCDETTMELYGKSSHEIMIDKLKKYQHRTKIELIVENILIGNNIDVIPQYYLDGYYFDLYAPSLNILIECDGDYWHGYNLLDNQLDEIQYRNRQNDLIKNNIALKHNIKLYRFWEHQIHQKNFEEVMLKLIWEK